jgi:hypothetical protein
MWSVPKGSHFGSWHLKAAVDYALIRIIALFPISIRVRTSLPAAPAYFEIVSGKRGKRTRVSGKGAEELVAQISRLGLADRFI